MLTRKPTEPLRDLYRPAAAGSFEKGIPPPQQGDSGCVVATAAECFSRGHLLLEQASDQETKFRAVSLLSQACDGKIQEACDELNRRLPRPKMGTERTTRLLEIVVRSAAPRDATVTCRIVANGELKGCTVTAGDMALKSFRNLMAAMRSIRLGPAMLDGVPVEVDLTVRFTQYD